MPAGPGDGEARGPRLVLLSTTHRVAPGLLSWPAWRALHDAAAVLVADRDHPLVPALDGAGTAVDVVAPGAGPLLDRAARASGPVVYVLGEDGEPDLLRELGERVAAAPGTAPEVELLPGSYDLPGARLLDLVAVMDRLRAPGGCPWDAEQTHASLVRYLLEECYELAEAIDTEDRTALREELGDVLLQVVFHARIAAEDTADPFTVDDVAAGIVDKLIGRHPHVFADGAGSDPPVRDAATSHARWDAIKVSEKNRTSATDGVPLAQPALALAEKLIGRAARAGLDVPVPDVAPPGDGASEDEVGAHLLAVVARARASGHDPERALRTAARAYRDRIHAVEASRAESGGGPT